MSSDIDRSFRLERGMTGILAPESKLDLLIEEQKQVIITSIIGTSY